jgi:hypothetical protein
LNNFQFSRNFKAIRGSTAACRLQLDSGLARRLPYRSLPIVRGPPYLRRRRVISGRCPAPTTHGGEAGGAGRSPCGSNQRHVPLRDVRHDVQDEGAPIPPIPKPYQPNSSPSSLLCLSPPAGLFTDVLSFFTVLFMLRHLLAQTMIDHDQETVRRMLVDNPDVTRALFRVRFLAAHALALSNIWCLG